MAPDTQEGALSPAALRLRLLTNLTAVAVIGLLLLLVDLGRWGGDVAPAIPPVVLPVLVGGLTAVAVAEITRRRWRVWRWQIIDRADGTSQLVVERGIWTRTWQAVPFDRIQFVETTSGPLQRSFGLANLSVRTAGVLTPAVPLDDLETAVAETLRRRLAPGTEG